MKVFIPSTGTPSRLFTHNAFPKHVELTAVFHNVEQSLGFINMDDWTAKNHVLISGVNTGYIGQMQWIENLVKEGEWFLKADDNIRAFIGADGNALSQETAWQIINEAINEAEKRGAKLVGFATVDNPFFRKAKYRDVGFCMGKMYAQKKVSGITPSGTILDDYERTAQHLERFGRVLVDNSLHSKSKHYEKGGIGTWDERLPQKMKSVKYLMERFPGLYRIKEKAGKEHGSEMQMRFTSLDQVERWRIVLPKLRGMNEHV